MTAVAATPEGWGRTRWWLALLLVMAAQLAFIFILGERNPPRSRDTVPVQTLQLTVGRTLEQELLDPTLFTRPHAHDFSAASWLRLRAPDFPVFRWSEPARPLDFPVAPPGRVLSQFLQTNLLAAFALEARPAPGMRVRGRDPISGILPLQSQLLVEDELSGRAILNAPELPAWPAEDLLTNTVVQIQVDESGLVWSAAMLGAERVSGGSGSPAADRYALDVARSLRFAPRGGGDWLSSPVAQLTRGILVFKWCTLPPTNGHSAPAKTP